MYDFIMRSVQITLVVSILGFFLVMASYSTNDIVGLLFVLTGLFIAGSILDA